MPHRKGHKRGTALGQDIETTPKVFKIGDREVSEEEFRAESAKLKSDIEGEEIRRAGGIGPEEIAARAKLRETPVLETQQEIIKREEEGRPQAPLEQPTGIDVVTGKEIPLLGGGVSGVTPEDITTLATLGAGGIVAGVGKKAITAGGKKFLISSGKVDTRASLKKVGDKSRGIVAKTLDFAKKHSIAKWTGIGFTLATEKKLSSVDTALSQIRENMPLILANVASTAWTPAQGFERLDELEEKITDYEQQAKSLWFAPSALVGGRLLPIQQRVAKLQDVFPSIRANIAKIEAQIAAGVIPDPEEIALLTQELDDLLKDFGKPSKFLGVI